MKKFLKILFSLFALFFVATIAVNGFDDAGLALAFALPVGFSPLSWPCGSENMGGYKNRLLFIPDCSVTTIPSLPAEATDAADLVTATGSFTFKSEGAKPIPIYATDKTVKMKAENQGDADGQSFKQSGEFFHPGSKAEVAAFARKVNNTAGFLIIEDTEGVQYMIGSKGLPATIKPSFDGGGERTDRRGFMFTFEADSFCPFIILGTPIDMDTLASGEVAGV